MSEPTLTEEDREALGDWWDSDWPDTAAGAMGTLYEAVERIVARHRAEAALAALVAVLDRADEGIEFGPENYLRLCRIVGDVNRTAVAQGREESS